MDGDEPDGRTDAIAGLGGIRLETGRVEVRLSRAAVKARLFRRAPEATRIGRFVVLERVGMGGMGIVYAAYDPQLDRRVALKVMRDDVVRSRRSRQQLQLLREARAMAKLSHPNVVAVYDAGTLDGQVFVAMEFVPSRTLKAWMADNHPAAEVLRVFSEAGEGLAAAHAVGLVHRDFKPENVLVPTEGAVRVTDFGLARADEPEAEHSGSRWLARHRPDTTTATASMMGAAGTPAYMSPEQMRGGTLDARSDQWGFCLALYEALSGRRPYGHPELLSLAQGVRVPLPPLPDTVAIGSRARGAIERGLSFQPDDRFTDMDALLLCLRKPKRSRAVVGIGVAAVLAAGVAIAASIERDDACPRATERLAGVWDLDAQARASEAMRAATPVLGADTWQRLVPLVDTYTTRWLDLRQDSCHAADRGELSAELLDLRIACLDARLPELAALSETLADADADVVEHAVESAVRLTPLDACLDPKALRDMRPPPPPPAQRAASAEIRNRVERARALRRAGKASTSLALIEHCLDDAETLGEPTAWIEAQLERGRTRAELADRAGAATDFDAVIERGATAGYLSAVAEASVALVDVVGVDQAHHDAGLDLARMASVAVALAGDPALLRAQLSLARGRVLYVAGRADEGLVATQEGLDGLATGDATPLHRLERAAALRLQAKLTLARDEHQRTVATATEALEIFEDMLGPRHPEVATTLAHLAAGSLRAGNLDQARQHFERAADIQREVYGEAHPAYGRTIANLGSVVRVAGHPDQALEAYRQAVTILGNALGDGDPRVASLWINIGGVEADLQRPHKAEAAYRRGLKSLHENVGERHPQAALALANIGRLELGRGDTAAAQVSLRRALKIREDVLGPQHIETARSRLALADALLAGGERDAAVEAYASALRTMEAASAPEPELVDARQALAAARDGGPDGGSPSSGP